MCARLVASRRCCFPKPPAYRNSKNQKHTHGAALIMMLACCSVVARQAPLTSSAHVLKLNAAGKRASASSPPGFGGKAGRKANVISIASPRFFKTDSEHHQHHRLLFLGGSWQEKPASSLLSSSPATWKQAAMMLMMLSVRSEKPRGGAPDDSRFRNHLLSESDGR